MKIPKFKLYNLKGDLIKNTQWTIMNKKNYLNQPIIRR